MSLVLFAIFLLIEAAMSQNPSKLDKLMHSKIIFSSRLALNSIHTRASISQHYSWFHCSIHVHLYSHWTVLAHQQPSHHSSQAQECDH